MPHGQTAGQGEAHRRLLVVDDEVKIGELLGQYFSLKGYEVRVVGRGDEALALTRVFHPDVVLLDLLMPGMSGVDTLKALRGTDPTVKVIILSGADHEDVVQGTLNLGADFYVCKPPRLAELEHLVSGFYPPNNPGAH